MSAKILMKAATAALACVTLIAPVSMRAATATTFSLVGVGCSTEDCSMTGTFDYSGSFSNIDITMIGAVLTGKIFNFDQGSTATQLFAGDNNNDYLVLNFAQPLPTIGGNDAIASGCIFSTTGSPDPAGCIPFFDTFKFFGSVESLDSATPLPAALPLFASGLGALGLLGWRRKRKAASAIATA